MKNGWADLVGYQQAICGGCDQTLQDIMWEPIFHPPYVFSSKAKLFKTRLMNLAFRRQQTTLPDSAIPSTTSTSLQEDFGWSFSQLVLDMHIDAKSIIVDSTKLLPEDESDYEYVAVDQGMSIDGSVWLIGHEKLQHQVICQIVYTDRYHPICVDVSNPVLCNRSVVARVCELELMW